MIHLFKEASRLKSKHPHLHGRRLNCTLTRNRYFRHYKPASSQILPSVDLEPLMIPCRDQGQEGSCTSFGHGGNADWRQIQARQGQLSEDVNLEFHKGFVSAACNFIYGQERTIDGDFSEDNGSFVHTGAQVATQVGFISEAVFPYGPETLYQEPTEQQLAWAATHKLKTALPVDLTNEQAIMAALSNNDPVVFGWTVYASIQNVGSDGIIPMPSWFDSVEGGHCTSVFGYKEINGQLYFKIRNSWGTSWGANGYAYMPAAYITNPDYASDGWVIK
jgi:C1A family cysteine protease